MQFSRRKLRKARATACVCFDLTDKYKVAEDPMVAIQLSRSFRRNMHSIKVKRHREYALHRKCCINGCTRGDFAGLC